LTQFESNDPVWDDCAEDIQLAAGGHHPSKADGMSKGLARVALAGYRVAGIVLYPLASPYLAYRAYKGKEDRRRRNERFGYPSAPRPRGPLVWVHSASVGETLAMIPLMREFCRREIHVLLTTGTVTSAELVRTRLGDQVIHQYVPIDLKFPVKRFLQYWRPDACITAESEIWPTTVMELSRRKIPQIRVNARISDRSFDRWRRYDRIAETLFGQMSLVVAQSDLDAERFRDLGAWPVLVSGNLKGDTDPPPFDAELVERYRQEIGGRRTWAAISTFEGEEKAAGKIHKALKARNDQLTIIVPRHPDRADGIEEMLKAQGLVVARRSRNDAITPETDIFLGDSMGEMGLYLRLTEVAFVGRSLTGEGGQNPLEPAMVGCAILSGSRVDNFRDAYANLVRRGGARLVRDTEMLAKAVHYLLSNDVARKKMIDAGQETVQEMRGALSATVKALEPYINPLTVSARLQPRNVAAQ
jgi:3-deoxy-D-manno-octulosonic-acid transferase